MRVYTKAGLFCGRHVVWLLRHQIADQQRRQESVHSCHGCRPAYEGLGHGNRDHGTGERLGHLASAKALNEDRAAKEAEEAAAANLEGEEA